MCKANNNNNILSFIYLWDFISHPGHLLNLSLVASNLQYRLFSIDIYIMEECLFHKPCAYRKKESFSIEFSILFYHCYLKLMTFLFFKQIIKKQIKVKFCVTLRTKGP